MRSRLLLLSLVFGLLLTAFPVLAHHSTTMYNMTNPVTVTGVVKRFEWTNPHAYEQINEFVCENNRDYKPLFGNK